jgi:hypothetical protein
VPDRRAADRLLPRSWAVRGCIGLACLAALQLTWEWARERGVRVYSHVGAVALTGSDERDDHLRSQPLDARNTPAPCVDGHHSHSHTHHSLNDERHTAVDDPQAHTSAADHVISSATMEDAYCNSMMSMSMSMSGYVFAGNSKDGCIIFLSPHFVIDSAAKYTGASCATDRSIACFARARARV